MSGSVNTLQCPAFEFTKRGKQSYERRVFIESILYSSGTAGTEEPVSFTEYKSFHNFRGFDFIPTYVNAFGPNQVSTISQMATFRGAQKVGFHCKLQFHLSLLCFGNKPKKYDFVHQTICLREVHVGQAQDQEICFNGKPQLLYIVEAAKSLIANS